MSDFKVKPEEKPKVKYGLVNETLKFPVYKTSHNRSGNIKLRKRTGTKILSMDLYEFARIKGIDRKDIEYFSKGREYDTVYVPTLKDFEKAYPEEFGLDNVGAHDDEY